MKTILLTGATDGIGLATASMLAQKAGELKLHLLLHGRNAAKLEQVKQALLARHNNIDVQVFTADLSIVHEVYALADTVLQNIQHLDVLINNAGVFVADKAFLMTKDGLDLRFAVNTVAPYILTKKLLPLFSANSRIVNLASAAQSAVNLDALAHFQHLDHDAAYAQSKLALIMWGMEMAKHHPPGPMVIAVNPKSFLGSKMVHEAYGRAGHDLNIGADILVRAALSDEFANANGTYFDNDYGQFASPHPNALNEAMRMALMRVLDRL